jgi:hypothetical protein
MKTLIVQSLIFIAFLSCTHHDSNQISEANKMSQELKEKNIEDSLVRVYNAMKIDFSLEYTYKIQEEIAQSNSPLLVTGFLKDISFEDSVYVFKITDMLDESIFEVKMDKERFERIKTTLPDFFAFGYFIIKPVLVKSSIGLASTIENEKTDDENITQSLAGKLVLVKGDLIDVCFNSKD